MLEGEVLKNRYLVMVIPVCAFVLLVLSVLNTFASNQEYGSQEFRGPLSSARLDTAQVLARSPGLIVSTAGCVDDAAYVADVTVPDNSPLAPGEVFTKTWRVKNTGTCNWRENYRLIYDRGQQMGGPAEMVILDTVPAGDTAEVSIPLVAPDGPGAYSGAWRMADDEGVPFGETLTVVIVVDDGKGNPGRPELPAAGSSLQPHQPDSPVPSMLSRAPLPKLAELDTDLIDDSILMNVTVPTPTPTATPVVEEEPFPNPVKARGRFNKTWIMRNSGMFDWGSGHVWAFVGGDQMGAPNGVEIPPTAAGGRFEVEVPMIAPADSGVYEGVWQMRDPDGKLFGTQGVVRVKVNEVQMNEPVRIGNWEIRVVRVERDTIVWKGDDRFEAAGVFALIRMKVTYLGEGTGWMNVDLDFSAHDEDGYSFSHHEDIGDAARWMVANHAAIDYGFPPETVDYPVLIAFPVPAESKELWLDVSLKEEALNWIRKQDPELRIEDLTLQASFYLRATESKRDLTYKGTFIDASPMDE